MIGGFRRMVFSMDTTTVTEPIDDAAEPEPDFHAFAGSTPSGSTPSGGTPSGSTPASGTASGGAAGEESSQDASPPGEGRRRGGRKPRPKSPVRQHVEMALAISGMPKRQRDIVQASLRDDEAELADLVVAAIEAGAKGAAPVAAVLDIAAADPIEAGILATELADSRRVFAAAWRVLIVLGADLPTKPTAGTAKAGLRFARAVLSLDKQARSDLSAVKEALSGA